MACGKLPHGEIAAVANAEQFGGVERARCEMNVRHAAPAGCHPLEAKA
jgi:hypothetical protein